MIELFDETYGKYYHVINDLIDECVDNGIVYEDDARQIISRHSFSAETEWIVLDYIKQGRWSVLEYDEKRKGIITSFDKKPARMPFSLIEKRWIKSILSDPRAQLFDLDTAKLEDVDALYNQEDNRVFDLVSDGDPYDDPSYRYNFKLICDATAAGLSVNIKYKDQKGDAIDVNVIPKKIEYSEKDDKFRVIAASENKQIIINMARIDYCNYCQGLKEAEIQKPEKRVLAMKLTDERNALERAATHFSQYRKIRISRIDESNYYLEYEYDEDMENELVMRAISFGSGVKVLKPDIVVEKIKARLSRQDIDLL